ncbi:MAG: polysaccharide biosynthesis tyrosine autokinase [Bacteroidota bacterium]
MTSSAPSRLQQTPIAFDRLLSPLWKYWYIIGASVFLSVLVASIYLKKVRPVYETQTTILIKDNERNGLTREALQKEILEMSTEPKIYEDTRILHSRALMQAVVDSLNLQHRLLRDDRFGLVDLYDNSPVNLANSTFPEGNQNYPFQILNTSSYRLQLDEDEQVEGVFGVPLNTSHGTFLLQRNEMPYELDTDITYLLKISTLANSTQRYLGAFSANYDSKKPTLLDLYIKDEVPKRGAEILAEVVKAYNKITLEDKSQNRKNTLTFIDERIALLTKELNATEAELERYKTQENLSLDYKSDLPHLKAQIGYFERELVNIDIQQNMMNYINNALDSNQYQFFPLIDFGVEHRGLSGLIIDYNNTLQEKDRLKQTVTDNYPTVKLVDDRITSLRVMIQEEVAKNQQELRSSKKELEAKNRAYLTELNATPRRERELLDRKRQQVIKENLYKYLLEKREEAAISIAAVAENAKVIDAPFLVGQVSPKKNSILLGAAMGGLFLPYSILLLFTLFDKRLRHQEEVQSYTTVPILGSLVNAKGGSKIAIREDQHSPSAESFRSLRTNLNFFLEEANNQVIVVTSTSIHEGKSFTSINLGISYALSGKEVLLIDCDLRNPKMLRYLGVKRPPAGLSNYLVGQVEADELIHAYEDHPQLHYIGSGSIPQNPSELLMNQRLPALLKQLRAQYDIIILDSPAAGLVSDSISLSKFANASLYLARVGVTEKEDLKLVEQLREEGKLIKPTIVFNGVKKGKVYKRALKHGYFKKIEQSSN